MDFFLTTFREPLEFKGGLSVLGKDRDAILLFFTFYWDSADGVFFYEFDTFYVD